MRVTFRCDPMLEPYLPPPVAARLAFPDWLKDMPGSAFSPLHGTDIRTVKQCPPFVDAMSCGFVMVLPCDVIADDGGLSWDWPIPVPAADKHPRAPLSFHVPEQVTGTPLRQPDQVVVKFNSFWTIELEQGWSLLAMHPANRLDLPFRLLTGLVDADHYKDVGILFPAVWTDGEFRGVLPKGTPIAQCVPVRREPLALICESMDDTAVRAYDSVGEKLLSQRGVYRREYRARRGGSGATTREESPQR